jgi:ATP-dependent helicase HrpB
LRQYAPPEILTSDLAPFALDLAQWGVRATDGLALLDAPPAAAWNDAQSLLRQLGALDGGGAITAHGRDMSRFGAHPRLAHMLIQGAARGWGATAAALAAILSERDVVRLRPGERDADMRTRLELMRHGFGDARADRAALARAREQAGAWRRQLGAAAEESDPDLAGPLIALAFPERVAQRRGAGSFRLRSGNGATLDASDALAQADWLAVATLDGGGANATIYAAAPLALTHIEDVFAGEVETRDEIGWDPREQAVVARQVRKLGALVLRSRQIENPPPEILAEGALTGIREAGLDALSWTGAAGVLRSRMAFARRVDPGGDWPDVSGENLNATLEDWLGPFLGGVSRRAQFAKIDVHDALAAMLDWTARKKLDALAPETILVPSGSNIPVDYSNDEPVLAVRLQELFGLTETPRVGGGKVPVTLHLLSPARRPVQVTKDLRSFWANGYPEVKKDLKGRYPKHSWPDDPLTAAATSRAKPRVS